MELAGRTRRKGTDFAVRVKTGQHGLVAENLAHGFHFFIDPATHHQLATDAANQNRQTLAGRVEHHGSRLRRRFGAIDQFVGAGVHQLQ